MELINSTLPFAGVMSSLIGGRKENQDTCGYTETPRGLLVVVCDGMGGGPAGKTASVIATSVIIDVVKNAGMDIDALKSKYPSFFETITPAPAPSQSHSENDDDEEPQQEGDLPYEENLPVIDPIEVRPNMSDAKLLETAVKAANREMRYQIHQNPALEGMGTTVAAVLINKEQATIAHVGDSRIYQIRDKKMIFRTNDHSRVGEMVRMGSITEEQARLSAYSNIITRALGVDNNVEVEIDIRPYEKGDRFVLCTDGIWGAKPQQEMVKLFVNNPKSLQGTMDVLNLEVEKAGKEKGGKHDNFSAIILEVNINSILKEKMSKKVKNLLYVLGAVCCLSIMANIVLGIVLHNYRNDVKEEQSLVEPQPLAEADVTGVPELPETPEIQPVEPEQNVGSVNQPVSPVATDQPVSEPVTQPESNQPPTLADAKAGAAALAPLITEIVNVGKMKKGPEKNKAIEALANALETAKALFPEKDQELITNQIKELKKDKTKRDPEESEGQCNQIAKNLKSLL